MIRRLLNKSSKFIIVFSLVVSMFSFSANASAASLYDDSYNTISDLTINSNLSGGTCSDHDITNGWYSYILDESKWQNPSDANNLTSDMSVARASFKEALDHGRWAVSQKSSYGGSTGKYFNYVDVLWAENTNMELIWTPDHSVFASAPYMRYITITCGQSYSKGDNPVAIGYSEGSPGPISTATPYNSTPSSFSADDGVANFFVYTNIPNYPSSYEGTSIASNQQGAVISGNIQCANTNNIISNVYVATTSSVNGDALLSDDGIGGKNYRYYLWGSNAYALIITCDEDLFGTPPVTSNHYYYYTWACAPTSISYDPDLHYYVCAES